MPKTIQSRAVRYHEFGDPRKVLRLETVDVRTELQPNEVLVRWLAAPIDPLDINLVEGTYATRDKLPATAGAEGVGQVEKISAAQLLINPPTAYCMLKFYEELRPGDFVIQNAANSGLDGRSSKSLTVSWGLKTVNIIRDRPNVDALRKELQQLGADHVFTESEFAKEGRKLVAKLPIKLACNGVGGRSALAISAAVGHGGTCVTYGGMSRAAHEFSTGSLVFKDLKAVGYANGPWLRRPGNREKRDRMFEELQELIVSGRLKPTPVQTHQLGPIPLFSVHFN
ncbi:PKS-ER domain-containing protein [Aphelenchoides fujianensis]|nr:PKS-ER domain-containing protein [Aphelenchoides fujianensis]